MAIFQERERRRGSKWGNNKLFGQRFQRCCHA